jgi:hypothetical protein
MAGASFTITLSKDWEKFMKACDPARFRKNLRAHMRIATERNCILISKLISAQIESDKFDPNSELTKLLKGSSKPLIDSHLLARNITHELESAFCGLIGTVRNRAGANIARILHEGAVLQLTDARRKWLAQAIKRAFNKAGKDHQSKEGTGYSYSEGKASPTRGSSMSAHSALVIPSRPYIVSVFNDVVVKKVLSEWENAYYQAIRTSMS